MRQPELLDGNGRGHTRITGRSEHGNDPPLRFRVRSGILGYLELDHFTVGCPTTMVIWLVRFRSGVALQSVNNRRWHFTWRSKA